MAAPRRRIVKKAHHVDAVPGRAVADGLGGGKFLGSRTLATNRSAILEVELAERGEVLLPFSDQVRRNHHNDGPSRVSSGDAVRYGERDESLSHADLVGKNHTGLSAQAHQDRFNL